MSTLQFFDTFAAASPTIRYYGWDVVRYWYRQFVNQFFEYSWQVRVAYYILFFTLVTVIFLAILFARRVYARKRAERQFVKCSSRYKVPFTKILSSPVHWSVMNIETECQCNVRDFAEFDGETFSRLIMNIRLDMDDKVYLPNMQILTELTGVRQTVETCLLKGRNVEQVMQIIVTLPLHITEGRLAVYTNYRDSRIRQMSHLCLSLCTESDPFRYLSKDLDENVALGTYMSLHRLFGWLSATNRQMPNFLTIANRLTNQRSAAFMIEEVAYWGTEQERERLADFFMARRSVCRMAAMRAVAQLGMTGVEEELIGTWDEHSEEVKMELLRTVTRLNTGRQAAFLEKAYITAPSKRVAELALSCLYEYGEGGRQRFEMLRLTPLDRRGRFLLDQIESNGKLADIREGRITYEEVVENQLQDKQEDKYDNAPIDYPIDDSLDVAQDEDSVANEEEFETEYIPEDTPSEK